MMTRPLCATGWWRHFQPPTAPVYHPQEVEKIRPKDSRIRGHLLCTKSAQTATDELADECLPWRADLENALAESKKTPQPCEGGGKI